MEISIKSAVLENIDYIGNQNERKTRICEQIDRTCAH